MPSERFRRTGSDPTLGIGDDDSRSDDGPDFDPRPPSRVDRSPDDARDQSTPGSRSSGSSGRSRSRTRTQTVTSEQRDLLRGRGDSVQTPAVEQSGDALDSDARPPTTEEREQLADRTRFEADEIAGVSPTDGGVTVTPTAAARERIAREQFADSDVGFDPRPPSRQARPSIRDFDVDELEFEATGGGVTARPVRDVRDRRRREQDELQARDRDAARREAADELDVDLDDIELEETETGFVARAEVERERERPIADRFEAATGFEVPTESEFLSRPQAAAAGVVGGIGALNRRFSIPSQQFGAEDVPTTSGQARTAVETQLGIDLPDGEGDVLGPITSRVDDAVGAFDLDDVPSDTGEFTDAVEDRTGIDVPTESAVVEPLQRGTVGAAVRVGEAQRDFATDAEFGTTESDDVRFDFDDVVDVGADIAETAGDVNRRFSVPGAGLGTIDPDADPDRRTGLAGAPLASPGVATPPGAVIAGAVVAGTAAVGLDQARRRGELGIGSTTTDVREVEIGETDLAELEPTDTGRGTGEVGLGAGVGVTEVGLGDFVSGTEVSIEQPTDEPPQTPIDDSIVPEEFPRDPTRRTPGQVDESTVLDTTFGTAPQQIQRQREQTVIDVPAIEEALERQRRAQEGFEEMDGGVGIPIRPVRPEFPAERTFPTGAGAVVGREAERLEAAQTPSTQSIEATETLFEQRAGQRQRVDPFVGLDDEFGLDSPLDSDTVAMTETDLDEQLIPEAVPESVQMTATTTDSDTAEETDTGFEYLTEPVETFGLTTPTPTPVPTPDPFPDRDSRGDRRGGLDVLFEDGVFENPTQTFDEIEADFERRFGGLDEIDDDLDTLF